MVLTRGSLPVPLTRPAPPVEVALLVPPDGAHDVALLAAAIAARLGARVRLSRHPVASRAELRAAARLAATGGCDLVVPFGGDDELGDVHAAIAGHDVAVLLVPAGRAAEHARAVGHRTMADVVAALDRGRVRRVDVVRCGYRGTDGRAHQAVVCPTTGLGLADELRRSWQAGIEPDGPVIHAPRLTSLEMIAEGLPVLCRPPAI